MLKKTEISITDNILPESENDILLDLGHKKYKASIAYARALFYFAQKADLLEIINKDFRDFISVWLKVPLLMKFIRCHAIDRNTRKARIWDFFRDRIHNCLLYFIEKVIDNNHSDLLLAIYHIFSQMMDDVNRQRRVRVISAYPLNRSQKKRLQETLENTLNLEIILNNEIDPEVLGGFVCYTDSIKIDMSLKKDFEKLKSQILLTPCEGDKKI
jgi:F-type H+-transporting ATPase subunit delta